MATRKVTKLKTSVIERAWAKYGTIFIEQKDGVQKTLQPRTLLFRLKVWNESLSSDPVTRRRELDTIAMLSDVCRQALAQKEDPSNVETKAVTAGIASGDEFARLRQTPAMQARIREVQLQFPAISASEIVAVHRRGLPRDYEDQMFRTINEDRALEIQTKIKTAKSDKAARQEKAKVEAFKADAGY
jgi:hypothetical protein